MEEMSKELQKKKKTGRRINQPNIENEQNGITCVSYVASLLARRRDASGQFRNEHLLLTTVNHAYQFTATSHPISAYINNLLPPKKIYFFLGYSDSGKEVYRHILRT
jgi:hypothetical protein